MPSAGAETTSCYSDRFEATYSSLRSNMEDSEEQFQDLLANLTVRANRMLATQSELFPIALLLMQDGRVDVAVAAYESADQIPDLLQALGSNLSEKAAAGEGLASCLAYPDYGAGEVVAFLENRDNYCATVRLPVSGDPLSIDAAGMIVEDGNIYVFPVSGDS